jgi:hypothetical protein
MNVGKTTYAEALRSFRTVGEYGVEGVSGRDGCQMTYHVENLSLRALLLHPTDHLDVPWILRLFPPAQFFASLVFKDGLLVERHVLMVVANNYCGLSGGAVSIVDLTRGPNSPADWPAFRQVTVKNGCDILTSMDSRATEDDRRRAYSLNLDCLTRPHGCTTLQILRSPSDMLMKNLGHPQL